MRGGGNGVRHPMRRSSPPPCCGYTSMAFSGESHPSDSVRSILQGSNYISRRTFHCYITNCSGQLFLANGPTSVRSPTIARFMNTGFLQNTDCYMIWICACFAGKGARFAGMLPHVSTTTYEERSRRKNVCYETPKGQTF